MEYRGPVRVMDSEAQIFVDQDYFGLHVIHLFELDQKRVADAVWAGAVVAFVTVYDAR